MFQLLIGLTVLSPEAQTPGFDTSALDPNVDPCVDFYQYACGSWRIRNPIPPDRAHWSRFDELRERNLDTLRHILEEASIDKPNRSAVEQKIGDYYAACMDEQTIDRKWIEPIRPQLDRIAALQAKSELASEVARLHRMGAEVLFNFGSSQDFKNSKQVIAQADQGGLGLPDRAFYLDDSAEEIRERYLRHVAAMFELLGEPAEEAERNALAVMQIETALAAASMNGVLRRDPASVSHQIPSRELTTSLNPSFDWAQYFSLTDTPSISTLNIAVPDYFRRVDELIKNTDLEDWKAYLTWHLVHSQAPLLPSPFVNENFNFYGKVLHGAQQLQPRWKRCVSFVDNDLGDALGQKYVEQTFGAEGKERTLRMTREIEKALEKDIAKLSWMTPETRRKAIAKLHAIANRIGYPDRWRDYSGLTIRRSDALGNFQRASQFEFRRQLAKIGKHADRTEWGMTPPTVNAYYSAQTNSVTFPAGILQPPFFDRNMDLAVNYGAIGMVIGHELAHALDNEGRRFDAKGNLRDWWLGQDAEQFDEQAQCLVNQYSALTAADDPEQNAKITLCENTADNGGLRVAYMALLHAIAAKTVREMDGRSPQQRLFISFAQIWCENVSDNWAHFSALTDPHSPGRNRVNGVLQNMPEFQQAFGCSVEQPMVRRPACRVW
jgi:endothelin-converting enzyme/putative endopeptidase